MTWHLQTKFLEDVRCVEETRIFVLPFVEERNSTKNIQYMESNIVNSTKCGNECSNQVLCAQAKEWVSSLPQKWYQSKTSFVEAAGMFNLCCARET